MHLNVKIGGLHVVLCAVQGLTQSTSRQSIKSSLLIWCG